MDNSQAVDTLNDLIETSKDGQYGFSQAAEHVRDGEIRNVLQRRAQECAQAADELIACVHDLGGKPEHSGSVGGAAHRGWVSLRSALAGKSDQAMLEECERGEDAAVARYRRALEEPLPPTARSLVERQYAGVRRNHDQIKALRDSRRDRPN